MANILVTGGGGYVGAALVPKLLEAGHNVIVIDTFWYGMPDVVYAATKNQAPYCLTIYQGDIQDIDSNTNIFANIDTVIHLACVSNDPSFDLDPTLGKAINYTAFRPLVEACVQAGVKRFIYASSSSVYGVRDEAEVTEDLPLQPITDYAQYKAMCEGILAQYQSPTFDTVILRPATLCGYSPRMRLDLVVNIFVDQAYRTGAIKVFGGEQIRPYLHIRDMVDLYVRLAKRTAEPAELVAGKTWNVGAGNMPVYDIACIICDWFKGEYSRGVEIVQEAVVDQRSYRINSQKIWRDIGFQPFYNITHAVEDIYGAYESGLIPREGVHMRNVDRMRELQTGGEIDEL